MFKSLFPVKIFRDKILGLDEAFAKVQHEVEIEWSKPSASHNDVGPFTYTTYNSLNTFHNHPAFENITLQLEPMIKKCWAEYKFYNGLTPQICEMWINKTCKNSGIIAHNHTPYLLSGVMYIKMDPGMGDIIFENPNHLVASLQPFGWQGPEGVQYDIEETVSIQSGDVLIFPGWLRHKTKINETNLPRYAVSFNVGATGNYPVSSYIQRSII